MLKLVIIIIFLLTAFLVYDSKNIYLLMHQNKQINLKLIITYPEEKLGKG